MVRTRQRSFLEERITPNFIELGPCRKRDTRNMLRVCDDDTETDESGYIPRKRRRLVEMSSRRSLRISARQRLAGANAMAGPTYITRRTMRALKEGQGLEENNDASVISDDGLRTEDEPSLGNESDSKSPRGSSKGIRRSTRQRKSLYGTLNQSWILGAKAQDFSPEESSQCEDKEKVDKQIQCAEDDNEYEDDMYSRVKNQQRRKSLRRVYRLDKDKNNTRSEGTLETEGDSEDGEYDPSRVVERNRRCRAGGSQWGSKDGEEEGEEEEEEEEEEGEEETEEETNTAKYYLRQKKPTINRFQVSAEPSRQRKTTKTVFHSSPPHRRSSFHIFKSPAHKSPVQRRHATHNSSGSSSSSDTSCSDEDERRFERRKSKSMARARKRCLPMNMNAKEIQALMNDRIKAGSSLADVDPMNIDRAVTFDHVGGLNKHLQRLKEMILFPLLYPEVFDKFKIAPPRGVLFYGPPGTGKTLVARALANECSRSGDRTVAFFMRKGADCLSKWVGESERQLRLLFDQAFCMRPSIIFFDEIDGLAPVRSSRQDQIHSSIVSTLLALMDGLDNRGEVVVIGATNRIDSVDPALRRPGRFDREFHFPLPAVEDRHNILKIFTKDWVPRLSNTFIKEVALNTAGYCGADLKALCAEVALSALKRRYPQIYDSRQRLKLDISSIQIKAKDFFKALDHLVPAKQRSSRNLGQPLPTTIRPLLLKALDMLTAAVQAIFPVKNNFSTDSAKNGNCSSESCSDDDADDKYNIYAPDEEINNGASSSSSSIKNNCSNLSNRRDRNIGTTHRPRLLLTGRSGQGQTSYLAPALLHSLERFPVHRLDLPALFAVTAKAPEESCNQVFREACSTRPCILYLPHVDQWWETLSDTMRATFLTLLEDLAPNSPILFLATSDCLYCDLADQVKSLFSRQRKEVYTMQNPSKDERLEFFSDLILRFSSLPPRIKRKIDSLPEDLPVAPPRKERELNATELKNLEEQEESTLRELRLFLREILYKLARDRRFSYFTKPVDTSEVSDYLDVVKTPMDLETMLTKIDTHRYETVSQFLDDIDLICHNALEYNPDKDPCDKMIRHRACTLRDAAHSIVDLELDPKFEKICQEIAETRKLRGCSPSKFAPKNYQTRPPRLDGGCDRTVDKELTTDPRIMPVCPIVRCRRYLPTTESTSNNEQKSSEAEAEVEVEAETGSESSSRVKIKAARKPQRDERRKSEKRSIKIRRFPPAGLKEEIVYRRRRSLWFGASRRRIVRRPVDESLPIPPETQSPETRLPSGVEDEIVDTLVVEGDSPAPLTRQLYVKDKVTEDGELLNSDLSKDSGTACTTINDTPENKGDVLMETEEDECPLVLKETDESIKEVSSGFSSEDGMNVESQAVNGRLTAGGGVRRDKKNVVGPSSTPPPPPPPPQQVVVDETELQHLLDEIVRCTENCTVDTLQRFHCALQACVEKHRRHWDKTEMVNEMKAQLETFKKQHRVS